MRAPLWQQRKRSADLLAVASRFPSFPILLETYRECIRDVFDLPAAAAMLRENSARGDSRDAVESSKPSPFAASLLFSYVANYIYDGDAPLGGAARAGAFDRSIAIARSCWATPICGNCWIQRRWTRWRRSCSRSIRIIRRAMRTGFTICC